jgi:hypothetical protein
MMPTQISQPLIISLSCVAHTKSTADRRQTNGHRKIAERKYRAVITASFNDTVMAGFAAGSVNC